MANPLHDPRELPAETLRLLVERRDSMAASGIPWADLAAALLQRQVRDRSFQGAMWLGSDGVPIALAGWQSAGAIGRRGWLYLARGHQDRESLEAALGWLSADGGLPFVSWSDIVPGVSAADLDEVFRRRGYRSVIRADMHLPAGVVVPEPGIESGVQIRPVSLADESAIATLLRRVYHGEPERALFATTLDEAEDARRGVHDVLHGGVGRWLPAASFGAARDGELVGYALANDHLGGLITEVGIDPALRRRGLARALLARTTRALRSLGYVEPRLVVTMWNDRAVGLYRRIGFEFTPGGTERMWLDLPAFGIAPSSAGGATRSSASISPD